MIQGNIWMYKYNPLSPGNVLSIWTQNVEPRIEKSNCFQSTCSDVRSWFYLILILNINIKQVFPKLQNKGD